MKRRSENIRVYSTVTLARNLEDHPFPVALKIESGADLLADLMGALEAAGAIEEFSLSKLEGMFWNGFRGEMLTKFGLDLGGAAPIHGETGIVPTYLVNEARDFVLALNCGEHFRLLKSSVTQSPAEMWRQLDQLDTRLESHMTYACDERYGYLTSDIALVGTGLKASILLDLPCLTMLAYMDRIVEAAVHLGVMIEKVFDTSTQGSFYRLSNRSTLGIDEAGILEKIEQVAAEVIKKEVDARETLFISKRLEIEDRVMRSYGLARYSRLIKREEFYRCLSDLKLGVYLDLIDDVADHEVNCFLLHHTEFEQGAEGRALGLIRQEAHLSQALKGLIK